ncbi:hypothetical protein PF005_g13873 [Phytophthora fragariae]|uniref:Uncharacterized protein n=1 Tax=Phytophthora fragariae TaxID=53985 RepID=A0A6A3XRM2_9STRA|nr:hypothetical protein PF005_g13873 [Phytophthora fragariae]
MPGAERHSGARKWRACSHGAPKKQTKGDGRAAKGQYGTYSWPMEKLTDHYGTWSGERRAWLTLILRFCILQGTMPRNVTPGSKRRPAGRFVLVGGVHGVGGGANGCSALVLHATAASRLVAASELEHGKLRLASSKRCPARVTEDCGGVRAADCMLQLPSSKVRGRWWRVSGSVAEAGGGVRAADGKLPLPSRRFMTPEVGRSWRY